MIYWTTIDTFGRPFTIGHTELTATITVSWTEEQEPPEGSFDFGDEQENAEYLRRFQTGEVINVCVRVRAAWDDANGSDYLGMCHLLARDIDAQVIETVKDHGMVEQAIADLIATIKARAKTYAQFAEVSP